MQRRNNVSGTYLIADIAAVALKPDGSSQIHLKTIYIKNMSKDPGKIFFWVKNQEHSRMRHDLQSLLNIFNFPEEFDIQLREHNYNTVQRCGNIAATLVCVYLGQLCLEFGFLLLKLVDSRCCSITTSAVVLYLEM